MTVTARADAPRTDISSALKRETRKATRKALLTSAATFGGTLLTVVVIWQGSIWAFGLTPFVAKGPADVYTFLFDLPASAAQRADLLGKLGETLADAVVGFAAGLALALVAAIVFQLSKGIEAALMPIALLLRSVPLIAFAPVIIMIFGRDFWTVAVMGGIVVLFPALVNIAFGLKSASPQMVDLVQVYGGNSFTALRKVALPASLPAFFAAVRISAPGAITGALLAEWLATGGGIGGVINGYVTGAQFNKLWAAVVLVTAVSLVLYNVMLTIENTVLTRMGMHPEKRV